MVTILKNASITTLEEKIPEVEAMVVEEEKIIDLGYEDYILKTYRKKAAEVIDLGVKRVVPGFNDAHLHLYQYTLAKSKVDLTGVRSVQEMKTRVQEYLKENNVPQGQWVEGKGWNDKDFGQPIIPDRRDLDKISRDHPMLLKRACYHAALVNTRALEICEIGKDTPDPEGGKIDRDQSGIPTGILYETAIDLVENRIPQKGVTTMKSMLKDGFKDALSVGLTSIQTDEFINLENPEDIFQAYLEMAGSGEIPLRVNLQLRITEPCQIEEFSRKGFKTGYGDEYLKIGPLKIICDGSLGARTAALREPYQDKPSSRGELIYSREKLQELVCAAHRNGFQLAIHAIGDRGIELALEAFDYMLHKKPVQDARPIIVHAQIGSYGLFDRMKKMGTIAAIQPIFLATDWSIINQRVGHKRASTSYAWGKMLKGGIALSGSSDAPIEPFNPLLGIYAAVTRKDLSGEPEGGWHPEDKLSIEEALKLFTIGGSYQSFEEKIKGTLSKGKLADFVVLADDILAVEESRIKDIQVLKTYVGGKLAYSR